MCNYSTAVMYKATLHKVVLATHKHALICCVSVSQYLYGGAQDPDTTLVTVIVDSHAYCICYVNVMSLLLYHINCERSKCILDELL